MAPPSGSAQVLILSTTCSGDEITPQQGRAGKDFVSKLARLFRSYAETSTLEPVALKAAMLMPLLLLQKPSSLSKARDYYEHLSQCLRAGHAGDLDSLVREGRIIHHHLSYNRGHHPSKDNNIAWLFAKLMLEGQTHQALQQPTKEGRGSILPVKQPLDKSNPATRTVHDALRLNHPSSQPIYREALIAVEEPAPDTHPVIYDDITGLFI